MNCQEDCPYMMPCGDCTDCSNRNNCDDFTNNMVSNKCVHCFSSVGGYYTDVFMNPHKQTQKFGVKYKRS